MKNLFVFVPAIVLVLFLLNSFVRKEKETILKSTNNGKTWRAGISDALPPSMFISSIKQMGKYLIVGHSDGIFRSADMGKTWTSVHPSVEKDHNYFRFFETSKIAPKKVF